MTEDEAKTKWCPFARMKMADRMQGNSPVCVEPQTTFNRIAVNGRAEPMLASQSLCLGSQCMAWRWIKSPDIVRELKEMWRESTPPERHHEADSLSPMGFCGLAGQHDPYQQEP